MKEFIEHVRIGARLKLRATCGSCCMTARYEARTWKTIRAYRMLTVYVACRRCTERSVGHWDMRVRSSKQNPAAPQTTRWCLRKLERCFQVATFTEPRSPWHLIMRQWQ